MKSKQKPQKQGVFLSVLICIDHSSGQLESLINEFKSILDDRLEDYEIVVLVNDDVDKIEAVLRDLIKNQSFPQLQAYTLGKTVDRDTAIWILLEKSLGDFVVIFDEETGSPDVIPSMLTLALDGNDAVFARNTNKLKRRLSYRFGQVVFNWLFYLISGVNFRREAPPFKIFSRKLVSFILSQGGGPLSQYYLPVTAGFKREYLDFDDTVTLRPKKRSFRTSVRRGLELVVSTSNLPMRIVSLISLFGAGANLLYSLYVVLVAMFAESVAPGWVSTSFQLSGMFFLNSLVLFVLSEYILNAVNISEKGKKYNVTEELSGQIIPEYVELNLIGSEDSTSRDSAK